MFTMRGMQLLPLGDSAVLVVLVAKNREAASEASGGLARTLNHAPLAGITDIVPSFTTVTVHYDPAKVAAGEGAGTPWSKVTAWIKRAAAKPVKATKSQMA